ncbi:MAG: hypothetical protein J0I34_32920 [Pseudonocardia sp.]|uniref:hypothetical protein n=1 Tax=unclassified Pseudonocardia TaxID=2619320 RepID=UPI0008699569|nr:MULTISPECIES: hypothetical protein [unclassified Pseudonocardia]MBN9113570.1 hypothetical protein [Pseudonocardia sp.]ODU29618.1 MAG: hypothetical protein ABS80_01550 [Pseudonocardia sp. SCN 72-51]ODV00459.1 MAG: hypothetical protein ABT15_29265 [Pseudonocardia sp. SCN 73-27]
MSKGLWRSDYTGSVSAGRETALFRIQATIRDDNAGRSDGRPLWVRVSSTADARKLAADLTAWAESRDAWESRDVPRAVRTSCERELWRQGRDWVDPFGNGTCIKRKGQQPHTV